MTLKGISSMATRHVLAELADAFQQQSGHGVSIESVGGVEAARRVLAGEALDFVVLAADAFDPLEAAGRVVPGSRIGVARSGVAVAVVAGGAHPDIANEAAVRQAVLHARSIGYSTGPSGVHLTRLFERWGIAKEIEPRMVKAPPGVAVGSLVARGEAEIGFQQVSELIHVAGVTYVGPIPAELQAGFSFAGAITGTARQPEAGAALLRFLSSPDAAPVITKAGLAPVPGNK